MTYFTVANVPTEFSEDDVVQLNTELKTQWEYMFGPNYPMRFCPKLVSMADDVLVQYCRQKLSELTVR